MDPARKRKVRLVVALGAALLLAGTLLYTSFASSTEAKTPSQVLASGSGGGTYEMTGKVVPGSITHQGATLVFQVRDRKGSRAVPVRYTGTVPDPFRDGREVIVTGRLRSGVFVGERNSLVTKCPSKFQNDKSGSAT
ncbi:MAG: cytochrome c-type biosis protein CcmE [Thermoleophilaceae bacterium]|jgi:cytochrome c-type biogenesis protein CcmE|nr:cytochrome c-type biosis protein CcmE [Thermoleophilaceae bacterium]MEA2436415.1 cytochrome c-type biosis protein CcmE [Thermoleophilaceae bacterium]